MLPAPCKDCTERHPGCHSECEKYAEYSRERAELSKSRRAGFDFAACHKDRIAKAVRRKWKKGKK